MTGVVWPAWPPRIDGGTITPAEAAAILRALADRLDGLGDAPIRLDVTLNVPDHLISLSMNEPTRRGVVDQLASAIGTTADVHRLSANFWQWRAAVCEDAYTVAAVTYIKPQHVCGCGRTCDHHHKGGEPR